MLAHNKVQSGNSQDHYQLPPPQQQPQRHEHRQFVHQHQLPEHEHGRLGPQLVPEAQAPQKRICHQVDEHERHYSVGQDPLHHLQHHARSHRQVDLSRPRSRTSTIHPTIANMVSPMSPHRPRSHPYSFALPPISTATATTTPPRTSSAYRSFSPASSSSSSSSSSSRNVSLSPGLESEATMLHHTSRGHSASQRGDEMAEVMKQEYDMEELSYDSMMDQCEPQREWSTSSSQHTNSPSPVMCSSAYSVPVQEASPYQQHPSLQKHNRYRREFEEEDQQELKVEKEGDHQLKQEQPFGDQYTHTSLSHERHPRSSQRHWQPQRWEQYDQQQQHNGRKREYDHGLDGEQQQQRREEHMIQPPSPTSDNWNRLSRRRGSGSTDYSTTATVTAPVLPSSSALSSSAALPLPSLSFSSISLTRRMANLYPPRKQQQSSHTLNLVPNSPNNATSSPPQHSSLLSSTSTSSPTTTASSSCLPPLRRSTSAASAGAATTVNSASNNTTHVPSRSLPFALSSSSREKLGSSSSGRSLPPPPLHSTTTVASTSSLSSSAAQQYQHTQPPSPTTKRPIDVSEDNTSYEYRSKAQRMLYERHPPSPIDNTNNNGRSASSSPSASRLSHVSDREHSAPPSPPSPSPVHATTTLANRASFGSLREYQSDRRQNYHSYQSQQQQHQRQEQQIQHRHQYPQQMSLPLTSSLSQYEHENRLPQMGRPQQQQQSNQQHPQSYRHSYPQYGHRSGSTGLGLEQPKLSSLAFSQRQPMESESSASSDRSSNSGSSGSSSSSNSGSSASSSSNSAACSLVPRLPIPSTIGGDRVHSQIMPAPSSAHQQLQRLQPLPGTEGMTVVKNDEGAIMVYNPATDAMTFRCELCPGESFGRIHDLKRHQASKHQEMTWPCDFCHRPFVRRDALLRHYTVKAARDDGLHPATHEVEKLLAARAKAKMLY